MIDLLNRYYVPVFISQEDYSEKGPAPQEEKEAVDRIYKQGHAARMSVGTVHVYLIRPDGNLFDSIHVAEAAKAEVLPRRLEAGVKALGVAPGGPLVAPTNVAHRRKPENSELLLHVVARREGRGSWGEFPGENWVSFSSEESRQLAGPADAAMGFSWEVPRDLAYKIFRHIHPQTEDCSDKDRNTVKNQSLRATVVAGENGTRRLRLNASLQMKRPFYPNHKDDRNVDATMIGYADVRDGRVTALRLVTDKATYGKEKFIVAVSDVQ
ncbi:MAG: hypothetical protein ACR2OZ_03235 [Verrucomicrobiales bacterium]